MVYTMLSLSLFSDVLVMSTPSLTTGPLPGIVGLTIRFAIGLPLPTLPIIPRVLPLYGRFIFQAHLALIVGEGEVLN